MKAEEKKLLDIQFKNLGNQMKEVNSKIDKFIADSTRGREHLNECLVKIKVDAAKNRVMIGDNRITLEKHEKAFETHVDNHESYRNKTIATGGGIGGFLGLIVNLIMSQFGK